LTAVLGDFNKENEMTIYNVTLTLETTVVVVADDPEHAIDVARDNARRAIEDAPDGPEFDVSGEVTSERNLRDGWDGDCIPYGGDGNTRIKDLLTPNA